MKKGVSQGKFGVSMLVLSFVVLLQGCAHARLEKQVDNKIDHETAVKSHSDLRAESADLVRTAPGLSDDQRQKLSLLRTEVTGKLDPLWSQSLKLRAILIHDLLSTPYDEDEVELIKERLTKIEDQRLNVIFGAVTQANVILGRLALENHALVNGFFDGR